MKREQELNNEKDFHRIVLSKAAIEDISYIKSILDKIHKKDIIAKVVWEAYIQGPVKELMNRIVGTEKKTGIYKITKIDTKECYIGQAADLKSRLTQHIKGSLGIQTIADQRIHHEMADIGIENWFFEILEECSKEELNEKERYWINFYRSNEYGYNQTRGNK